MSLRRGLNKYYINKDGQIIVKPIKTIYARMDDEIELYEFETVWATELYAMVDFNFQESWEILYWLKENGYTQIDKSEVDKYKMMETLVK